MRSLTYWELKKGEVAELVYCTGLENRRSRKGSVSSNLTLSAMESCPSGLWSTLGKRVHPKGCHRFESYTFRIFLRSSIGRAADL